MEKRDDDVQNLQNIRKLSRSLAYTLCILCIGLRAILYRFLPYTLYTRITAVLT